MTEWLVLLTILALIGIVWRYLVTRLEKPQYPEQPVPPVKSWREALGEPDDC